MLKKEQRSTVRNSDSGEEKMNTPAHQREGGTCDGSNKTPVQPAAEPSNEPEAAVVFCSLARFLGYFLHLGTFGFGSRIVPSCFPWLLSGLHGPASAATLGTLLWYFAEAGVFVFGSGLAIIPFLHQGVVERFGWLNDRQFLDAVAVAMITPGPVIITAGFIGYLAAGPLGAVLASVGVFLPPYLLVLVLAPHYRRFAQNRQVKAFVQGVTAAATGAIAGAAFVLGRHALVDLPSVLIALTTVGVLLKVRKFPEPLVILAAGAIGLLLTRST
jgi:chromate transport protein ChrA